MPPYVLIDDIEIVFSKNKSLIEDESLLFSQCAHSIRTNLSKYYKNTLLLSKTDVCGFIKKAKAKSDSPLISLTTYVDADNEKIFSIESTRALKLVGNDEGHSIFQERGIMPRHANTPKIQTQIDYIFRELKEETRSINIIDDVVFSGDTVSQYVEIFQKAGFKVEYIFCNVALSDAIKKLVKLDVEVISDCVLDDVIDIICLRDFILGAPHGGRNLILSDGSYQSVPYGYPFGEINKWASLRGEAAHDISRTSLEVSKLIWEKANPEITFDELGVTVHNFNPSDRIVAVIERLLENKAYEKYNPIS